MKSGSDGGPPSRIRLVAAWPGTELLVRDSHFRPVASAVGHLDVAVAPGLYQVERRLGDAHDSSIVVVRPGAEHVEPRIELNLSAAAPVAAARHHAEEHRAAAERASRAAAAAADPSAGMLVLVADGPAAASRDRLELRDAALRPVDAWQRPWSAGEHGATWHANLTAGGYLLRLGGMDVPLWAPAGWQTIVFLHGGGLGHSVHLVPYDRPWSAWDPANTAVEVALSALPRRSAVFRRDVVDVLLRDRVDLNPMVGILAAHALRLESPPDGTTHDLIADRLAQLLPGCPDVVALSLWRDGALAPAGRRIAWPPMVATAYRDLVVPADIEAPGVLEPGSLAYQIAGNIGAGGPLLRFVPLEPAERPGAEPDPARAPTARAAARVRRFLADVSAVDGTDLAGAAATWAAAPVARSTGVPLAVAAAVLTGIRGAAAGEPAGEESVAPAGDAPAARPSRTPRRARRLWILAPLAVRRVVRRLRRLPAGQDNRIDSERVSGELRELVTATAPEHVEDMYAVIDQHVDSYASQWRREMYERYSNDLVELDLLETRLEPYLDHERGDLEHREGRVIHGDVAQVAGRTMSGMLLWVVVLVAFSVDIVAFHQALGPLLAVPDALVWVSVFGWTAVALSMAHSAGLQTRRATSGRDIPHAATGAWVSFAIWLLLGVTAFLTDYMISGPPGTQETLRHLSALLFLVLYVATGAVAALQGFYRQDPAARQHGVVLRGHAHARARLGPAEQAQLAIERARERREELWELSQQQCTDTAVRLKQQARLWMATAHRTAERERRRPHE
ncbi:hypothetical protein [Dactylosporangium sp. CA-139066]|uniref:hypothetical protein n=1 Tax=Dactylosporangium sp. CA-139066 TaxID=3239930 RepID=UPI003D91973E